MVLCVYVLWMKLMVFFINISKKKLVKKIIWVKFYSIGYIYYVC